MKQWIGWWQIVYKTTCSILFGRCYRIRRPDTFSAYFDLHSHLYRTVDRCRVGAVADGTYAHTCNGGETYGRYSYIQQETRTQRVLLTPWNRHNIMVPELAGNAQFRRPILFCRKWSTTTVIVDRSYVYDTLCGSVKRRINGNSRQPAILVRIPPCSNPTWPNILSSV